MKLLKHLLPEILGMFFSILLLAFGYLIFSLIFEISNSRQFLDLSQYVDATSISIVVAITLFFTKEIIEIISEHRARLRKISALKTLISEEIELNYWAWKKILDLANLVKNEPNTTNFFIVTSASGKERFEYRRNDGSGGGQGFPPVYEELINKLIVDIAELDKSFYVAAIDYMKALACLNHLRGEAYDNVYNTRYGMSLKDFSKYALDELPDIFDSMNGFYKVCGHAKLDKHRMR